MKALKRTVCIIMSVLMLLSVAAVSVSAEESGKKIYFDASGWQKLSDDSSVFCHIWERGGNSFFSWQEKKEKCVQEDDGKYSYDISALDNSKNISGGLQSGKDYCVIFSAYSGDSSYQTYDCTFGTECIGDTLKITGAKTENPVDSEKRTDEAEWTTNNKKYGPHLALTSIGNVIGKFLCPNEKGIEVIGDWLPVYYKSSFVKPVDVLAKKAYPAFGIKTESDLKEIYNYIVKKKTGEDEAAMKKILEDAFLKAFSAKSSKSVNTIKVNSFNKTFKAKALKKKDCSYKAIKVSKAQGKVTYKVTKKNSKLTFKNGKLTVKRNTKKGIYKITVEVTASGNEKYSKKTVKSTVKVTVK